MKTIKSILITSKSSTMSDSQLKIYEDEYQLDIEVSWFSAGAIFLALFCFAWMSFLFFWYTNVGGAPWIFYVFPLIHVAVGVGLSYTTLCMFFNKSTVAVNNDYVSVKHGPIPWWRGNVHLASEEIEQVYVKEKKSRNDNSTSYTYAVMAKLYDGSSKGLLDITMTDSQKALELEKRIEQFLGIEDAPVAGEFGKSNATYTNPTNEQRERKRRLYSKNYEYINKKIGSQLTFDDNSYEVVHENQYDWKNGNSDKQLQLLDYLDNQILLYIKQNRGIYNHFVEEKMSLGLAQTLNFSKDNPQSKLLYSGEEYILEDYVEGKSFLGKETNALDTQQWRYTTANKKKYIRVINNNNLLTYYAGSLPQENRTRADDFFDLNQPIREKEIRKNWADEDFV